MKIDLEPLTGVLGAEVAGLDLRQPLDDETFATLRSALLDHLVLFFRDQPIPPDEHLALARRFGPLDIHPFGRHLDSHPEVGVLDQSDPSRDGANRWHVDSSFMPKPPLGSVLHSVKLPATGGDTSWSSMYAAYDMLSPPIKRALEGLTASHDVSAPLIRAIESGHSVRGFEEVKADWPPVSHPVVCCHPDTGRKFLFVNSNFATRIEGVSEAESDMLLRFIFDWVRSPDIQVRFHWEKDSVALWDNRCTQHFAAADYSERRVMHRVTVAGQWVPTA